LLLSSKKQRALEDEMERKVLEKKTQRLLEVYSVLVNYRDRKYTTAAATSAFTTTTTATVTTATMTTATPQTQENNSFSDSVLCSEGLVELLEYCKRLLKVGAPFAITILSETLRLALSALRTLKKETEESGGSRLLIPTSYTSPLHSSSVETIRTFVGVLFQLFETTMDSEGLLKRLKDAYNTGASTKGGNTGVERLREWCGERKGQTPPSESDYFAARLLLLDAINLALSLFIFQGSHGITRLHLKRSRTSEEKRTENEEGYEMEMEMDLAPFSLASHFCRQLKEEVIRGLPLRMLQSYMALINNTIRAGSNVTEIGVLEGELDQDLYAEYEEEDDEIIEEEEEGEEEEEEEEEVVEKRTRKRNNGASGKQKEKGKEKRRRKRRLGRVGIVRIVLSILQEYELEHGSIIRDLMTFIMWQSPPHFAQRFLEHVIQLSLATPPSSSTSSANETGNGKASRKKQKAKTKDRPRIDEEEVEEEEGEGEGAEMEEGNREVEPRGRKRIYITKNDSCRLSGVQVTLKYLAARLHSLFTEPGNFSKPSSFFFSSRSSLSLLLLLLPCQRRLSWH
jgi:hypothetical protein